MSPKNTFNLLVLCFLLVWNVCPSSVLALNQEKIRLALYVDKGAHARSQLCDALSKDPFILTTYIDGQDIRTDCLSNFDVLFIPGGSGKKEAFSLGQYGQEKVCQFVANGGIYIGVCAGCYLASCAHPEYLNLLPATTVDKNHWRRGKAMLQIELTKLGLEIFGLNSSMVNVLYHNGPVLRVFDDHKKDVIPLAYFRNEIVAPDGQPGAMTNAPAMVLAHYGKGLVLGISPHPEATPGLETMEPNAIHWLFNHKTISQSVAAVTKPLKGISSTTLGSVSSSPSKIISLSERVYNKAENIFEHTISSHYEHLHDRAQDQAEFVDGMYKVTADCSGFVSYVIHSVAPKHYALILKMTGRSYPHAKTYAAFFSQLNTNTALDGWQKIGNYIELKRGDIIAWQKHVMIVINPPGKIRTETIAAGATKYVEVYVLDSSSVEHFPPQSLPPLAHQQFRDGVGKGMIRLILDNQNNVIGYWEGTFSYAKNKAIEAPTYTNNIGFARLVSVLHPKD